MIEQLTIDSFSAAISRNAGPETAIEAIERVYDNASELWKSEAQKIIYRLCQNRMEFDLDDVAEALKPIDHIRHKPRAVGNLMRQARDSGWCRQTGVINSKRASRHGGYIATYESLLCFPQAWTSTKSYAPTI